MAMPAVETGVVCADGLFADRSNLVDVGYASMKAVPSQILSTSDVFADAAWSKRCCNENDPYLADCDLAATGRERSYSATSSQSWVLGAYPEQDSSMECDLVSDETLHGDDSFHDSSSSDLSSYPADMYVPLDGTTQDLMEAISSAKGQELEISPDNDYLHRHGHTVLQNDYITARMRNITAGWMVEVTNHFQLQPETLFLAINLLDRYLSRSHAFPRNMLQLLAVTSVMVASKQEEVSPPSVEVLTEIAANCFKQKDLLRMEHVLLNELEWRSQAPTTYTFISMFSQAMQALPWDVFNLAAYFGELAITEYCMLEFAPSVIAAASLLLGCFLTNQQHLRDVLAEVSGYSSADLESAVYGILQLHNNVFHCYSSEAEVQAMKPYKTVQEKHIDLGCLPVIQAPIHI